MSGPYAIAVDTYWAAGWRGILPLPEKAKKLPPKGYTGEHGRDPSYPDIRAWADDREGRGNIALRMPPHVIGIDVDDYGDKQGGQTLTLAEAAHGELPPTWRTTSRDDGVSGIRLYRVPEGLAWPGEIGASVEVIQHAHRYAVVWPSVHPEGGTYRWINPHGVVSTHVPDPDEFPPLPDEWVAAYTGGVAATHTPRVDVKHNEAVAWIAGRDHATADMCTRMEKALEQHVHDLPGSAHNSTRDATLRVARLADEGHHGAVHALTAVRQRFLADATNPNRDLLGTQRRTTEEATYEFAELVSSAVGVVLGNPTGLTTCDCYGQLTGLLTPPAKADPPATDGATALDPMTASENAKVAPPDPQADSPARFKDGATFILDAPETMPNLWGEEDESLWAEGEALMIVGPPGVGKTTLTGQVVRGLIGLQDTVLGLPIQEAQGRVLYLAMDRPAQIARGLRRAFHERERPVLADRLQFWEGPPPGDVAKHPTVLLSLAQLAEADVIIIDSVKDAAVGLSEDEVAAAYNRARQNCLANGVQVLELHHMVKRGVGGNKPKELADVYGSAWLTAGAGSVVLLWGAAGDPIVEMVHLKQPAGEVGPWRLRHDHDTGNTTVHHGADLMAIVASGGASGITTTDAAKQMFDNDKPSDAEKEKARRRLQGLVKGGHVTAIEKSQDPYAGGRSQTYFTLPHDRPRSAHADSPEEGVHGPHDPPTAKGKTAGQGPHGTAHGVHATPPPTAAPPFRGGQRGGPTNDDSENTDRPSGTEVSCSGCYRPVPQVIANVWGGRCGNCAREAGLT